MMRFSPCSLDLLAVVDIELHDKIEEKSQKCILHKHALLGLSCSDAHYQEWETGDQVSPSCVGGHNDTMSHIIWENLGSSETHFNEFC